LLLLLLSTFFLLVIIPIIISSTKKASAIPRTKITKGFISAKKIVAILPKPPSGSVEVENNILLIVKKTKEGIYYKGRDTERDKK